MKVREFGLRVVKEIQHVDHATEVKQVVSTDKSDLVNLPVGEGASLFGNAAFNIKYDQSSGSGKSFLIRGIAEKFSNETLL